VTHLIKGRIPPEVKALIQPYPDIVLRDYPRPIFRLVVWWHLLWLPLQPQQCWVLVDNEKTAHQIRGWIRWLGRRLILVHADQDQSQGFRLSDGRDTLAYAAAFDDGQPPAAAGHV
jgi:hypothetical protein